MINKSMNQKMIDGEQKSNNHTADIKDYKPNELGGFSFSSHIKVYDPNNGQVLVQKRGDI